MQREYQKPRVGVSACLLGEPVRYDGGHKRHAWLVDVFGPRVEWVPVCPEVEAGFGTPRETIDLVKRPGLSIALMTTTSGVDLTARMRAFAERRVEELARMRLSGYVLKAESPSCGLEVRVIGGGANARGLFADALVKQCPELPIEEEQGLADADRRLAFVDRVFAYHAKMQP
jgi:uncharacterized protein YbbK (DUF523 family)